MNELNFNTLENKIDCLLDKYTTINEENMVLHQQLANYNKIVTKLEGLLVKIKEEMT